VPTTIEFVDIAGLVKGASVGQGLGNKFLSHIREVDAIIEVVRDFKDENVIHVNNKVDPEDDIKTINLELVLADLETVNKRLGVLESQLKGSKDKQLFKNIEILKQVKQILNQEKFAIDVHVSQDDEHFVKELNLLTFKPLMYVYNVDENQIQQSTINNQQTTNNNQQSTINKLTICAKLEAELASLSENEVKEYLAATGINQTGLDKLILQSYNLLNLITFFTSGPKESHAWTIVRGTKAPQAAGKIHSDFEKGFIRAEMVNWLDLINVGNETLAKEKGLVKTQGKDYAVQDGDVANFLFNQ